MPLRRARERGTLAVHLNERFAGRLTLNENEERQLEVLLPYNQDFDFTWKYMQFVFIN